MRTVFRLLALLLAIAFVGLAPAARAAPADPIVHVADIQAPQLATMPTTLDIAAIDRMPLMNWPTSEVAAAPAVLFEPRSVGSAPLVERGAITVDYDAGLMRYRPPSSDNSAHGLRLRA